MTRLYISSRPDPSVLPRAQSGYTREHVHGPLQGMDEAQDAIRTVYGRTWRFIAGVLALGAGFLAGHMIAAALFGFERINLW